MAQKGSSRTVFTVRIDGLELDEEAVRRLEGSIRRTVLAEFAELDVPQAIRMGRLSDPEFNAGNGGNGSTGGIAIVAMER